MKCMECGKKRAKTSREDYAYDRHGMAATLVGVQVVRCPDCGAEDVVIPRIAELDRVMARRVVDRPGPLRGPEVRFLRKFLGYAGADFAALMGVAAETVSRWENDRQAIDGGHDRALRLFAIDQVPIDDYRALDALNAASRRKAAILRLRLKPKGESWSIAA